MYWTGLVNVWLCIRVWNGKFWVCILICYIQTKYILGMSCPSWQWHSTGSHWSPVWTLLVVTLWCDLGFFPNSRGNKAAENLQPTQYLVHTYQTYAKIHTCLFDTYWHVFDIYQKYLPKYMAQSMSIKRTLIGLHQFCIDFHFMPILTKWCTIHWCCSMSQKV